MSSVGNITPRPPTSPSHTEPLHKKVTGTPPPAPIPEKAPSKQEESKSVWESICSFFASTFWPPKNDPLSSAMTHQNSSAVSFSPKITIDPIDPKNIHREHLNHSQEKLDEIEELECLDVNWLIKEAGLDRKWLKLQIDSLQLEGELTLLNEKELIRLHEIIKIVSEKIEEIQKERLKKGETDRLFGKMETISSIFLLATVVVIGLLTAGAGIAGVAIPLIVQNALTVTSGVAAVWQGGTQFGRALNERELDLLSADNLKNREDRNTLSKWILHLYHEIESAKKAESAERRQMSTYLENQHNTMRLDGYV